MHGSAADTLFPLGVSATGRTLLNQSGSPYLICGDSGQAMINRISLTDVALYADTRKSQGFNSVLIELMCHHTDFSGSTCPASFLGDQPFLKNVSGTTYTGASGTADFSTPNPAYWNYVNQVLDVLSSRGMLLIVYPLAWGFGLDGTQGWWPDMMLSANTRAVHTAFGNYLGARYSTARYPNIIWLHGSDSQGNTTGSPESGIARAHALMTGMIASGATQLRCFDGAANSESTDAPSDGVSFANYVQVQGTYDYGTPGGLNIDYKTGAEARRGWNYTPVATTQGTYGSVPLALPSFLKETSYTNDSGSTSQLIRQSQFVAVLSGALNGLLYGFGSGVAGHGIWDFDTNWKTDINHVDATDTTRFAALLRARQWWKLIPSELSGMRQLVVSANGVQSVGLTYVASACASDGSFAVAYNPPGSANTAQAFNFDTRSMNGTKTASWIDVRTGAVTVIGSFANTLSSQTFTPPNAGTSGDGDWLWVLE
jgi:hypothetical protein